MPVAASRALALSWFHHTLTALAPQALVRAQVPTLAWERYQRVLVVAFGKAAGTMLDGVLPALPAGADVYLALPEGAPAPAPRANLDLHVFRGGHPQPNQESLQAAAAMLAAARRWAATPAAPPALLLALISGGGSSLAELPLGGDLEAAQGLFRALVMSGAPIGEINTVRRHQSAFKGGRLAAAAAAPHLEQVSWILSDVPGGDLSAVASGPTCPDATTIEQAQAVLRRWLPGHASRQLGSAPSRAGQRAAVPLVRRQSTPAHKRPAPGPPARSAGVAAGATQQKVASYVELCETPKPGAAAFARSRWLVLADNTAACACLASRAREAGYAPVAIDSTADEWESTAAAQYLVDRWRRLRAAHRSTSRGPCLIAGGEVRVRVPPQSSGRGGRNQDLALRVAQALEDEEFCFLSAGTDGVDGSSDAAGACVDGATCARARAAGCDPSDHLARFDAEPLLAATGDLIRTGPTGNNLRDLRVFL